MTLLAKVAVALFAQEAANGATPTLFAATESVAGGSYAGPGNRREMAGPPVLVGRTKAASNLATAARLWSASEQLTGVRYPASPAESIVRGPDVADIAEG